MSGGSNAGPVVTARNAAFEEDAMKSWGVLPSDNTVWWLILWIVMTAFFAGVAWFIMDVINYYYILTARSAFAIWVGLSWLLVWQVGARIAAHERRRFGSVLKSDEWLSHLIGAASTFKTEFPR